MDSTLPIPSRLQYDSRLQIDRLSNLPSINTFGELSNFLRAAIADEDSCMFSESIGELAAQAEVVLAGLHANRHREHAAPLLMDMLTVLREHRNFVVDLGLAWRGLYEYAAYLQALNNFRVLIGHWLLHTDPWDDTLEVTAEDFALVAWRTLGEGMLLIDMYEQWLEREDMNDPGSKLGDLPQPQVDRVLQWWQKLRR
jgi:hypothetical protein